MESKVRIAPSLLSADFARLAQEIAEVEAGGADLLHLDVMDGHFVRNITFGPPLVKAVAKASRLPKDVHLMITDPLAYVQAFAEAGADIISFHVEAGSDPSAVIDRLLELKVQPAIAIRPDTTLYRIRPLLDRLEMVLVMTVFPGFGGQSFIPDVLPTIRELRAIGYAGAIEVDGGIGPKTAPLVIEAGADVLVAGSSIFGQADRARAIAALRPLAQAKGAG